MRQIIETTDGKYLGLIFNENKLEEFKDPTIFKDSKIKKIKKDIVRYYNSNYSVLTKEV